MLILQLGSEDLLFWNVDIERSLKEIVLDWSQSDLISAFLITEKSIKDLTVLNTNSSLTLESLVHTIRSFLIERYIISENFLIDIKSLKLLPLS